MNWGLIIVLIGIFLWGCVPARKYQSATAALKECEEKNKKLTQEKDEIKIKYEKLDEDYRKMEKSILSLQHDTMVLGTSLRQMRVQYDKVNALNDELLRKQEMLLKGATEEKEKMFAELMALRVSLEKKQEQLNSLEKELNTKQSILNDKENEIKKANEKLIKREEELSEKEKKIKELTTLLDSMRTKASKIKEELSKALMGFSAEGLEVKQQEGKIYVIMEQKLLFPKAEWTITPRGKEAIVKLAKSLEKYPNIRLIIEGHTDKDPYKGSGNLKDNWDLSVIRATAVTRIILENSSIKPHQLIPAGRAEFVPVDPGDTEAAKSKNRRVEFIIEPDLTPIYKLIE